MANLCCSVEMEPRTLKSSQMHHAREVAVGIFQKTEPLEVSNVIIIQGEEQVISIKMDQIVESTADKNTDPGTSTKCSCTNPSTNHQPSVDYDGHDHIREPHTAPF
ncbi:hypothetical protein V2J09_004542 [Rumex salicifolius]